MHKANYRFIKRFAWTLRETIFLIISWLFLFLFTLFRMGGGIFSPVTSTNVRISLQNFLTFSLIYKDSRKVKINRNYASKCNLYLYFLIQQNLLIFGEKMLMSAELKECVTWFIYFLDLLWVRYNCAKFHHCRICVTDSKEGAFLSPTREQPQKTPSWIGLKRHLEWIMQSEYN